MTELTKKAITAAPVDGDPLTYVLSDETVDRVGDVISVKGWQLEDFKKNPVALFNHDPSFIVGHWTDVKVVGKQLIGKLNLLPAGISARLDEIRAVVEAGVLRATSVGFRAIEAEPRKEGGYLFKAASLLEASMVSVPANPNALQIAKSLNLSDDVKSIIFDDNAKPIPATTPAATGTKRVVKLATPPARDRAFTIRSIVRTK